MEERQRHRSTPAPSGPETDAPSRTSLTHPRRIAVFAGLALAAAVVGLAFRAPQGTVPLNRLLEPLIALQQDAYGGPGYVESQPGQTGVLFQTFPGPSTPGFVTIINVGDCPVSITSIHPTVTIPAGESSAVRFAVGNTLTTLSWQAGPTGSTCRFYWVARKE